MARYERDASQPQDRSRPEVQRGAAARAAKALADVDRFAAPGDEALVTTATLAIDQPFRFDRGLAKRLRLREVNATEAFTLRDAAGAYYRASVKDYDDAGGSAVAYERMGASPEPTVDVVLACAILARQRMHWVMQKATELGARRIVPLLTEYSVQPAGLQAEQPHAWAGHIARAAKQCRRSSLPHLLATTTLEAFLASPLLAATDLRLYLDDRSESLPAPTQPPKRVMLFVGPEGGFSDGERDRLAANARPWLLGGRVLRAETAALVGLTMVHATWGDFRQK
jgi:16S rRNA (uracil1498-N3)-methyltransferase